MSTTALALPSTPFSAQFPAQFAGQFPTVHRSVEGPACHRPRRRVARHPRTRVLLRPHARPLRLTRRGRLTLTCTAASVLTGAVVAVTGALTGASAGTALAPPPAVHTVLPGQTLSVIAAGWAPAEDWREVAAEIVDLNSLASMQLQAGQRLTMPDRD